MVMEVSHFNYCYAKRRYAECHYAKCRGTITTGGEPSQ
jgi:hypothetical protein